MRFVDIDEEGLKFYQEMGISPKIHCPDCSHDASRKPAPAKEVNPLQRLIDQWIPAEYQNSDEGQFPASVWADAKFWIPGRSGMLLYGPTRTCKSRMAYALVKKCINFGIKAEAYDCRTFRAKVEESMHAGTLWGWYRELQTLPCLLIDDLGKFNAASKRIEEEVFNVVKLRCEAKKGIIITMNDTPRQLGEKFSEGIGGPLIARLAEFCKPLTTFTDEELQSMDSTQAGLDL